MAKASTPTSTPTARKPAANRVAKPAAKATASQAKAAIDADEPVELPDPEADDADGATQGEVWLRGLQMLILAALFWVSQIVLFVTAVLQFGWLLFAGKRNNHIAEFGEGLADWQKKNARFQTAASDDKPFPWSPFGKD